jgi:hypothetical protein
MEPLDAGTQARLNLPRILILIYILCLVMVIVTGFKYLFLRQYAIDFEGEDVLLESMSEEE